MSISPENKNTPQLTPPNPGNTATPPAEPDAKSAPEFRTENIGKWKEKQENPFAEQNRKAAEEKQKREEKRDATLAKVNKSITPLKITLIVLSSIVIIVVIILAIIALIAALTPEPAPTMDGNTAADVAKYQQTLQEIYEQNLSETENRDDALQAVDETISSTLETANGREYENEILLAKMLLLAYNSQYSEAVAVAETINPDALELPQKANYYYTLTNVYAEMGDHAKADEYYNLAIELSVQVGNGYEGDDYTYGDEEEVKK